MAKIAVGRFVYDEASATLEGPADYLRERGDAKIRAALDGQEAGFNLLLQAGPAGQDPIRTLLVFLQTDYAGWKGAKQLVDGLLAREPEPPADWDGAPTDDWLARNPPR